MKIALYIEDGLEQLVLTPESKIERNILAKMHDASRELKIVRGQFYDCNGGWKRHAERRFERVEFRPGDDSDDSTIVVLTPKIEVA